MAVALSKENADFSIKPEAITPSIPTSEWPLLLKNYDKRETILHNCGCTIHNFREFTC
jgi:hypothetical protein